MADRVIWLSGPPGSGKTTAGRLAAARLSVPFESAGEIFRAEARAAGRSLAEFSRYAEEHAEVDRALDARLMGAARPGSVVDGRVVGALMRRSEIPVLAIRVTADEAIRAERVARRDGVRPADALREMRLRSESERARYLRWYGIDLDNEPLDATIDASQLPPEGVAAEIVRIVTAPDDAG